MQVILADINSHLNAKGIPSGHYFAVAKNYLAAYGQVMDVVIAGGPMYVKHFCRLIKLPFNTQDDQMRISGKIRQLCNLAVLFWKADRSVIILQSGAVATCYCGIFLFAKTVHRVYMIQYSKSEGLDSRVKRFLYRLARHKIAGILCPNEEVARIYRKPYCVLPDYVYLGIKKTEKCVKEYDFAVVGTISPEKGIVAIAKALAGTNHKVLIAGMMQSGNEELERTLCDIAARGGNIVLQLGRLSEAEYIKAFQSARYAVFNYSLTYDERSSGAVLDALYNHCPVVVHNCLAMKFIRDSNLGVVFESISDVNFCEILQDDVQSAYIKHIEQFLCKQPDVKYKLRDFLNKTGTGSKEM